jgi:hypothetical protein
MTKALYLLATTLGVGLVWFFAALVLLEQGFGISITDNARLLMLIASFTAAALVGWKAFVAPRGNL